MVALKSSAKVVPTDDMPSDAIADLSHIAIASFHNRMQTLRQDYRAYWGHFKQALSLHLVHADKDTLGFGPAIFRPNEKGEIRRKGTNVEAVSMLVLDMDSGVPLDEVRGRLHGYAWFAY